ncbi:hypothetical protein LCGC14_2883610 [marine sediment metagenome]|uniref:Uncharacterized protein n=1 Tax=marine sediment metagenome TaxID=412755 RepID=A0A0F9A7C9_9ZZZZ
MIPGPGTRTRWRSPAELVEDVHHFLNQVLALLAAGRLGDASPQMRFQDHRSEGSHRAEGGRNLFENLKTVPVVLHHLPRLYQVQTLVKLKL